MSARRKLDRMLRKLQRETLKWSVKGVEMPEGLRDFLQQSYDMLEEAQELLREVRSYDDEED